MRSRTWSNRCLAKMGGTLTFRFAFSITLLAIVLCPRHSAAQRGKEATSKVDKFTTVYGAKIHYVEAGTGAPLILVHGLADDVTIWDSVIPALSARFRVIALDQIGFGHSDKPLLNYRYAALAQAMDPRALSALRLASREDIQYLGALTFREKRFYQDVDAIFKQRVTAGDSYTVAQFLDSMVRGDDTLDNRLHALTRPTLVVWGRDDKLVPLRFGQRFHQEIANSQLRIIENCGHLPQLECPNEFATAVLQFLNDTR
ncbi:MAG: hypothetical protein DME85_00480 [Verrucomicrobia bacterium]|nr:MAG: hypothetical protein DME85_00480 [Verrucomicrobiota bacterium]